jgi:sulfatase modifying factor 1
MSWWRLSWCVGTVLVLAGCASPIASPEVGAARPGPNGHQLVSIPAGTYRVGVPGHLRNPRRTVHLQGYRVADAETTNEEFARFVEATGYITDAEKIGYGLVAREGMIDWAWTETKGATWRAPFGPEEPRTGELTNHPVTQISGADAEAYCRWIGGRLPTLEEWEVGARSGSTTRWPWGKKLDPHLANVWNGTNHLHNTREDGWIYTSPVRSFPPNAWGLYDVIGNVFEYCEGLPTIFRKGEEAKLIAGRGGSWWCSTGTCDFFNLVDIGAMDRHGSLANQGFRVVFDGTN